MRDGKARLKNQQFYQIPKNNQVSIAALVLSGQCGHGDLAGYAILENYLFCQHPSCWVQLEIEN
ncbi:MAG: hypothetical protein Q8K43_07560 [Sulfurimicrobium sp.]|nr:hypothetical protein [Sulfurimicrobium sp.]MDP1703108.1 hypothetical protein [Sulfurimicrobium sp.]MDP1897725.1 hypothetical protein [Sulfurimicrobium sp.]MDP2198852.1 hypothetical protein [Sulfurimicrobium sp.]MDP2963986.1 hypothetical protein [Sulfurimicrobium sp.]